MNSIVLIRHNIQNAFFFFHYSAEKLNNRNLQKYQIMVILSILEKEAYHHEV